MLFRRRLLGAVAVLSALVASSCTEKTSEVTAGMGSTADASSPDPKEQTLLLAQAVEGLGEGSLMARIETSQGEMLAQLFEDRAPKTVANFVGLARGLRSFQDVHSHEWTRRPFYDGTTFHRVIPDFVIQGGCPRGDGRGGPGYTIDDELHADLKHDRPGVLSMVNDGPNTNGSQFLLTERELPRLDGRYAVFGILVDGLEVLRKIARVPTDSSHKPLERVEIKKLTVFRDQ